MTTSDLFISYNNKTNQKKSIIHILKNIYEKLTNNEGHLKYINTFNMLKAQNIPLIYLPPTYTLISSDSEMSHIKSCFFKYV